MFHYADVVIRQACNKQILSPEKTVEQTKVLNVH